MKKAKLVLLTVALILSAMFAKSQTPQSWYSPEMLFDTTIYDNEGVRYSLDNIKIDTVTLDGSGQKTQLLTSATCTTYFNLYFEPGCGMEIVGNTTHDNRRNNLFQLFCDLSAFITNQGGVSNKVNIWIRNPNIVIPSASSSGISAGATAFYSYPYNTAKSGIIDNEIWKTINSGQDSYIGIASPLIATGSFYHGQIAFNFANTSNNFHDDLSTNPSGSELDLYTLGLHEMMHAMGFATGIYYNGNSKITNTGNNSSNYYTRYDQFLKTQAGVALITSSTSATCSMYQFNFNPALTATAVLSPSAASCGSVLPSFGYTNVTTCSTSIMYTGGSQNINVYTPNCYEFASSLSHFEDMCYPTNTPANNDQYFVMCSGNTTGMMKRYLKEEERKVLCDIGYSVAATYGTASYTTTQTTYTAGACNGLSIVGINDGLGTGGNYTYTTTVGVATGTIQPLTNDVGTFGQYECVEVVIGAGSLSATSGNSLTPFTYNPSVAGLHLLRYTPSSSTGVKGNITYIYVKVVGSTSTCPVPNSCEMVYNGGFESVSPTCGDIQYAPSIGPKYDCWDRISGGLIAYVRGCSVSSIVNNFTPSGYTIPTSGPVYDTWDGSPSNTGFMRQSYSGAPASVLQGNLTTNLIPSSQYKLSFWLNNLPSFTVPIQTVSIVSSTGPVVGPISATTTVPSPYTPLATFTVPADGLWHNYSTTFTFTGTSPAQYISIFDLYPWPNFPNYAIYFMDDISILPSSSSTSFSLPTISCSGANYNLSSLVSIPNGTFTGPGVSYSSPNYYFDANTAGTGLQTVIYTYTTPTGCTLTAVAQTSVVATPTAITVFGNPPAGLCSSYPTATLTASGATTYSWNPGALTGNTVSVSPTSTTVYTVTGANATCSLSTTYTVNYGSTCLCIATNTIPSSINSATVAGSYALNNATVTSGNYCFAGAEIICSPGSSLTIASGATLTLNQVHMYSCFDMWQGIVVQPGGYLVIIDCLIEDAYKAVDVDNNVTTAGKVLDIRETVFNKNYTGISISNYTQTASSTYTCFAIRKNIFTSRDFTFTPTNWPNHALLSTTCAVTNSLASPFCMQNYSVTNLKAPFSTDVAYNGITLGNVGATTNPSLSPSFYAITIGEPTSTTTVNYNIFDNLMYGISAYNSNVRAAYNVFQNTRSKQIHGNWLGGIAIQSTSDDFNNNNLIVKSPVPYVTSRKSRFYDCTYAIKSENILSHDIQQNTIVSTQSATASYQQGKYGIYATSNRFSSCDIANNAIYNIENGITLNTTYGWITFGASSYTNTQYVKACNILTNTISAVPSGGQGTAFVTNAITAQNVLSAGSTSTVSANLSVVIQGNQMAKVYNGINASNFSVPPVFIQSNTSSISIDPSGNLQNGISITANTNPTVQLNSIEGQNQTNTITTGIYASMNSAPKVTCNTVSTTYQGFEFSGSQAGTRWKGNSMTTHTLGFALTYTGVIGAQGSAGNPIDNVWNTPAFWTGTKFHTWTDNNTFASGSPLYVQNTTVYNPSNNSGNPTFQSYAAGWINTTTGAYSCVGGGARYGNINSDSVQVHEPTKGVNNSNGSGRIITGDKDYEDAYIKTLEDIAGYQVTKGNILDPGNYIAQYQLFRNIESDPTSYLPSKILSDFYSDNKNGAYGKLLEGQNHLIDGNYSLATSALNSISSKNNIENNYSDFYSLYSKYYIKNFDDVDNKSLNNLANKCPFVEGEVVYQARTLYNIINSTVEVFKDNCPDNSSSRLMNSAKPINTWDVRIYPNPANNELFLSTSAEKEVLKVGITDVNGRRVADYNLTTNGYLGNIKLDLSSGIYFVSLSNATGEKIVKKLVITK